MKCAKLHLQERSKSGIKPATSNEKPRRICQKRLIDPDHEEDQRWKVKDWFYCNENEECALNQIYDNGGVSQDAHDLFLSVQNLEFQGEVQQRKRPRTSFKYKTLSSNRKHRMFVKEVLEDNLNDGGRFSELTCYYFDDYAKYLLNDRSRPSTGKSNTIYNFDGKTKESKGVQTEIKSVNGKKYFKSEPKVKKPLKRNKDNATECTGTDKGGIKYNTQITYHKSGKRKSLTISRTESPATVQVIRVDVVCNYSRSSTMSDFEDTKLKARENKKETVNVKQSHFANKYLLTNTVKTLDENTGGARVTLLCKTFKLADRSGILTERKAKNLKNILRYELPKRN